MDTIIVSFLDHYKNVQKNKSIIRERPFSNSDCEQIGKSFSLSAKKYGMIVQTCFEDVNLVEYGFKQGVCLSKELALKITNKNFPQWKARDCGCAEMVDIGAYNTCKHFCSYCYANYDEKKVNENWLNHHPDSSLLIGRLSEQDVIKVRK